MIFWRISNYTTLDGAGGLEAPGRWHTSGQPIVYCAPNPATALLEVLVHTKLDLEDIPVHFQYLEIEAPDAIPVETLDISTLPPNWRTDTEATQRIGDEWLRSTRTALLRAPSVIVPETWNILMNPRHPESGNVRVMRKHHQAIDGRLVG